MLGRLGGPSSATGASRTTDSCRHRCAATGSIRTSPERRPTTAPFEWKNLRRAARPHRDERASHDLSGWNRHATPLQGSLTDRAPQRLAGRARHGRHLETKHHRPEAGETDFSECRIAVPESSADACHPPDSEEDNRAGRYRHPGKAAAPDQVDALHRIRSRQKAHAA